jgi:hypothetical protein
VNRGVPLARKSKSCIPAERGGGVHVESIRGLESKWSPNLYPTSLLFSVSTTCKLLIAQP